MSCAGTSLPSRPQIDSLPRYALLTDSLPHYARKRPQAWCLTTRKDVAALPGYARKFLPHHVRSHTREACIYTTIQDKAPVEARREDLHRYHHPWEQAQDLVAWRQQK